MGGKIIMKNTNIKTNAESIREGMLLQQQLEEKEYEKQAEIEAQNYKTTKRIQELLVFNNSEKIKTQTKYMEFKDDLKTSLLTECIYKLYSDGLKSDGAYMTNNDILRRYKYVTNFINEFGTVKLLDSFKTKTYLLSGLHNIIMETYNSILEKVDPEDPETFKVSEEDKDKFLDKLENDETEKVGDIINDRVKDAVNKFVDDNIEDKERIKDIVDDLEDTLEKNKNEDEEIKEGYLRIAKGKINDINTNKNKTIYEFMMESVSKKALTDEKYKEYFLEEDKINYNKVNEAVINMYAFLETLNTAKIINIDKEYMKNVCEYI